MPRVKLTMIVNGTFLYYCNLLNSSLRHRPEVAVTVVQSCELLGQLGDGLLLVVVRLMLLLLAVVMMRLPWLLAESRRRRSIALLSSHLCYRICDRFL